MSWHEQWQQASFRGVPFQVQEHDAQGGRRVASHEYPQRDNPYTEDLGRKQRHFTVQGMVVGTDYFVSRDKLITALEQTGAGLLVHPWLGRMRVAITGYTVAESTALGGMARFTIQCVESGLKPAPSVTDDTQAQTDNAAHALVGAAITGFTASYATLGWPARVAEAAQKKLGELASELSTKESDLLGAAAAPTTLAQQLVNAAAEMVVSAVSSTQALQRLFNTPVTWPLGATRDARQENLNGYQLDTLTNLATLAAVVGNAAQAEFDTAQSARDFLSLVVTAIDQATVTTGPGGTALDDATYLALIDLQRRVTADIQQRVLQLPNLTTITLSHTLPSLVVAWQVYGALDKEADIVARNAIRLPGFVPAAQPLQVVVA